MGPALSSRRSRLLVAAALACGAAVAACPPWVGVSLFHPIFHPASTSTSTLRGRAMRLPDPRPVRWSERLAQHPRVSHLDAIVHVQRCRTECLPLVPIADRPALSRFLPALREIADHATYVGEDRRLWESESAARERLEAELAAFEAEIGRSRP